MIDQGRETPRRPSETRRPIVVLLVDDQRFVGAAVGQLLATEPDIELHCCHAAVDAIALANQVGPAVVLQDLVMPDIDGLTLVGLFRSNPMTARTPIIVLSGNDDVDTRTRALAGGAADYLVKLPAKADLIACIRLHAGRQAGSVAAAPPAPTTPPADADATLDPGVIAGFQEAGSPDFALKLIDQFISEAESRVHTLGKAAERRDAHALNATAHSLKGSSMVMGARRLATLCTQVEECLARNPGVITPALMIQIDQELVRVRDALWSQRRGIVER